MGENLDKWQALSVRVTTFHAGLRADLKSDAITPTFGVEVESVEVKPQEVRRMEVASLGPGRLIFTSAVNRADWVWQVIEDKEPPHVALGSPSDAVAALVEGTRAWVAGQTDVIRLAVGGVFGIPVSSREEGYRVLDSLIPELNLDPASSEFIYQINRPIVVDGDGRSLALNIIEKWSCRRVSRSNFSLTVGPGGGLISAGASGSAAVDLSIHAICELDINTDVNNSEKFSVECAQELLSLSAARIVDFLTAH